MSTIRSRRMLAVLRLESHRARCLVIAEDLGTAPEGFSDAIMASGVLSYRVLPFEREADGALQAARRPIRATRWPSSPRTTCRPSPAGGAASTSTCARRLGLYDRERAERGARRARAASAGSSPRRSRREGLVADAEPPEDAAARGGDALSRPHALAC